MSTLQTSSRLELLQAWFQQRQLMEKEQKLLQIYDQQQQRAHQVAQRGSAGSNTSNGSECSNSANAAVSHQAVTKTSTTHAKSNSHGGKVRQMFDERRQTTVKGIDKSYPLEPLENKTRRVNGALPVKNKNKNSIATRKNVTSKRTSSVETNGSIKKDDILTVSYHEEVTRETFGPKLIHQDDDIDKFYNEDHVKQYYNRNHQHLQNVKTVEEEKKCDQVPTKMYLKNVRKASNKDKNSNAIKAAAATSIPARSTFGIDKRPNSREMKKEDSSPTPFENESDSKNENRPSLRKQSSEVSAEVRQISPILTRPTTTNSTTSTSTNNNNNLGQDNIINSSKIEMTTRSQTTSSGNKSIPPTSSRNRGSAINDSTASCKICGRTFTPDRINLHEQICAKASQKKRKTFDTTKQRVKGTEMEPYMKKTTKKSQIEKKTIKPEMKSNWRRKHEDFINAIRSAKQVKAHLAAGGKLSDLPPPPPSDTSDYIQCPHCGRKFNQAAADRHIPKCQHMQHNKPNPRAPSKSSKR